MTEIVATRRAALLMAMTALAAVALAACGRKSDPERPEDADPLAPRRYPVDRRNPQRRDEEPLQPQAPQSPLPQQQPESPFLYR